MLRYGVIALSLAAACRRQEPQPCPKPAGAASAPAVAPAAACPAGQAEGPLTWIRDDYAGALACATSRHVPLVVDLWAPWCHT